MFSSVALSRPPCSTPSYLIGITTSTPYGFPPTCASIQSSSTSSASAVGKASAPRTPSPPALLTAATTSRQWLNAKIGNSMPKVSQRRVRTARLLAPLGREFDGDALDPADEVRAQPRHGPGESDVRQPAEQLLEHDLDLEPREVRAETEVRPDPETQVIVRLPADVEHVAVWEDRFVAVRGPVPERHALVLADLAPAELHVAHRGPDEVHDGRHPAHHLLDRGV